MQWKATRQDVTTGRHFARVMWLWLPVVALAGTAFLGWDDVAAAAGRWGISEAAARWLLVLAAGLSVLRVFELGWQVWSSAGYRAESDVRDDELPMLTVVVPAFNEGRQVLRTLESLAASDYPADKLQVVAVDDGSADDTWQWIVRGREKFPLAVTAMRCLKNRGKKHALVEGFKLATGSVVVTVDSDSEVLQDTLRNVVAPIVRDGRIGAVAGNVRVLPRGNAWGRMLDVSFTFAFEFLRAGQGRWGSVMCCPGALSAWRKDVLDRVTDEWLAQSFFGAPATIGEDRALTNLFMREGWGVAYQSNAIVLTEVPDNVSRLSKMLLRWARSDVREGLVAASYAVGPMSLRHAWAFRVNAFLGLWGLTIRFVSYPAMVLLAVAGPASLALLVWASLLAAVLPAAVHAMWRRDSGAWWAFPWAVVATFGLSWIEPWSVLTVHKGGWLTRGTPAREPELEALRAG